MDGSGGLGRGGRAVRRWSAAIVTIIACAGIVISVTSTANAVTSGRDAPAAAEPSPSPSGGNEADVMAVVAQYEAAFVDEDCDLFVQVTTEAFREHIGVADCETFVQRAQGQAEVIDSIQVTPVSTIGTGRGTIASVVHFEVQSFTFEDGQRSTSPVQSDADYRHHFVRVDGAWKIDAVHDVTGGRTEGQLTADEQDAVDRMMADWSVAYSTGDCEAAVASTTVGYRDSMGWTECASFEQYISDQNVYCPMDVHQEDIRFHDAVDAHTGEIILDVVQVCTLTIDEFGDPIDPPYEAGAPYRYHLVEADGTWKIAEGENGAEAEDKPSNANERAAVETMHGYNQAWIDADCDAYLATTTEGMRNAQDLAGCASFGPAARDYGEAVENFAFTPTDIERPSATRLEIKSHETYDSLTDVDGVPVAEPFLIDEYWVYTLDLIDGTWVISDIVMLL